MEPQATFRVEEDSQGAVRVPAAALNGGQTQRAGDNFPVSGLRPCAVRPVATACCAGTIRCAILAAVAVVTTVNARWRAYPFTVIEVGIGR